jgi:hypothetical protein
VEIQAPAAKPSAATALPTFGGSTDEPQRDGTEGDGKRQVRDPDRHPRRNLPPAFVVHLQETYAAQREHGGDEHGKERGENARRVLQATLRDHRAGRESQQPAFARGYRRADQSQHEREMRNQGCRARNARGENAPQHHFRDRQDRDADDRQCRDGVFSVGGECPLWPPVHAYFAGLACRNASRSRTARL